MQVTVIGAGNMGSAFVQPLHAAGHAVPQAALVKGFNTVFAQRLAAGAVLADGQRIQVFLASDQAEAKTQVSALATSMGFVPVDAGGLKNARYLEPLAGLNIYFGYGAGRGTGIAPAWVGQG